MEIALHEPSKTERQKDINYFVSDSGCHICTSHAKNPQGYPVVRRNPMGLVTVARYIHYMRTGQVEINYDEAIMLKCLNRDCINPEHIYLADKKQRSRHKLKEGKVVRHSALTDEQILEIKKNTTQTSTELAELYSVSGTTVRFIWKETVFSYLKVENYDWYVNKRKERYLQSRVEQTRKANKGRRKK